MMGRFDLTDIQWERLEPLLPPHHSGKAGHPYSDHRRVINGIRWKIRTGAPWRDVPARYGSCKTCFDRFTRWQRDGTWLRIWQQLAAEALLEDPQEMGIICIDSTTTKAHPHAAGARGKHARPIKRGSISMSPNGYPAKD
jgi:transposase